MAGRPKALSGEFKAEENRAGLTLFVASDLAPGTLAEGFGLYPRLESPFERAVYMMSLLSEVPPFADGNRWIVRVMMNAESVAGGEERSGLSFRRCSEATTSRRCERCLEPGGRSRS